MMLPAVVERRLAALVKWGLFLLLPLPLFVSTSMLFPFITGRNFAFRIIIEILAVGWVGLLVMSREYRPRLSWLTKAVIGFLFVVTLADILGMNPYRSFWSNYERMEGLIALIHMVLFFLIASSVFRRFADWRLYLYGSSAVSVVVAFYGLLQYLGYARSYQGGFRVDSTIGNPAYLASYLAFNVFFLLFLLWREPRRWLCWLSGGAILFMLLIIYFTATRGVIVALVPVTFLLAVFFAAQTPREGRERLLKRLGIAVIAATVLVIGGFFLLRNTEFIRKNMVLSRFASISPQETTTQSRFLIWKMALEGVAERPVLGWGQENFYLVFNKYFNPRLWASEPWFDRSHNVFLDWLIHAGFAGLLLYLTVLFFGARNIWLAWRKKNLASYEALMLAALLAVYFFQNLFVFDNFQSYFLLFLTLAFTEYLVRMNEANAETSFSASFLPRAGAAMAAAGVIAVFVIYFANVKPILASSEIITALTLAGGGATIPTIEEHFHKALDYNTFGSGEAVEQLASMARNAQNLQGRGSPEDIKRFVQFAADELFKLANVSAPDAKHWLFLGSLYNANLSLSPQTYPQAALQALQRASELSPTKQQIYLEMANTYLMTQNPGPALAAAEKAAAFDPAFPLGQLDVALIAAIAGDKNTAAGALARYRTLVPLISLTDAQRVIQIYTQIGDLKGARGVIEGAISQDPNNANWYAAYAPILAALGDKAGAANAAEKAAFLNPALKPQADQFLKQLKAGASPH